MRDTDLSALLLQACLSIAAAGRTSIKVSVVQYAGALVTVGIPCTYAGKQASKHYTSKKCGINAY